MVASALELAELSRLLPKIVDGSSSTLPDEVVLLPRTFSAPTCWNLAYVTAFQSSFPVSTAPAAISWVSTANCAIFALVTASSARLVVSITVGAAPMVERTSAAVLSSRISLPICRQTICVTSPALTAPSNEFALTSCILANVTASFAISAVLTVLSCRCALVIALSATVRVVTASSANFAAVTLRSATLPVVIAPVAR